MKLFSSKIFLFLAFLLNFYLLKSQSISLSPYSFYGLGEKLKSDVSSHGMGGISTAYEHPFGAELNFSNPAANTQVEYTIFRLGASSYLGKSSNDTNLRKTIYFSDFALSVPISEKFLFAAAYSPYLGFFNKEKLINSLSAHSKDSKLNGKGSINLLTNFLSYKMNNELSFGLMGRYLQGYLENHSEKILNSSFSQQESIHSLLFRLGFLYSKLYESKKKWQIGAFFDLGAFTNFKQIFYKNTTSNPPKENEPIIEKINQNNPSLNFPPSASFAVSYGKKDRWMLSSQFDWEKTSNYNAIKRANEVYKDSYTLALGTYLIPVNLFSNYFSKIIYRAGIYYEDKGLEIGRNSISQYGFSLGIGLPLKKELLNAYIPYLNLSLDINQRGNKKIFKETYANFKVGLSFGGKWFRKRIYD